MEFFKNGKMVNCREPKQATVAVVRFRDGEERYAVIGTQYGYLHNTAGELRTWGSYSGAYKAAKRYVAF